MSESKGSAFVEYVVKGIVDFPEQVSIQQEVFDDGLVIITVKVAKDDMGKLIGKSGKMAKSIRTLLKAVGTIEKKRIILKIDEPLEE